MLIDYSTELVVLIHIYEFNVFNNATTGAHTVHGIPQCTYMYTIFVLKFHVLII